MMVMKKILLGSVLALCVYSICLQETVAQVNFKPPTASPDASLSQNFGESTFGVSYGRPSARGRKIFGQLIPYDSLWRTGANDCTVLSLGEPVIIGGKKIPAGKYSLFSIPGAEQWTLILNRDASLHGAFGYDSQVDIHRFQVKPEATGRFYETFTIEFGDFNPRGESSLNLMWENTLIKIPLQTIADYNNMAEIQKRLIDKLEQNSELLFQAAAYYHATKRDLQLAKNWVEAAEKLDDKSFVIPNLAQRIYGELLDYPAALTAAQRALALAEKEKMSSAISTLKKRISDLQKLQADSTKK
jgi:hypothetical protein